MTPLLEALRAGHAQTIEMLRRHGARVLLSDESKELCQAVKAGTVEYLEVSFLFVLQTTYLHPVA